MYRSANSAYERLSCGTVDDRTIPSMRPRSRKLLYERAELVTASVPLGRDPPVLGQLRAVIEPEHRLGVPHVDREQHGA